MRPKPRLVARFDALEACGAGEGEQGKGEGSGAARALGGAG